MNIPLGKLTALQLVYEASAACTSVMAPLNARGDSLLHIRSMDWEMDFLRDVTLELDVRKAGRTLFIATSWAGYVGILTGVKPLPEGDLAHWQQSFSVAVNYRVLDMSFGRNLRKLLRYKWPVGFLVRETLTNACDVYHAIEWLVTSELVAPTYLSICSSKLGAVVTRDRTSCDRLLVTALEQSAQERLLARLGDSVAEDAIDVAPFPLLVQTNHDAWKKFGVHLSSEENIAWSAQRHAAASNYCIDNALVSSTQSDGDEADEHAAYFASPEHAWQLFARAPCHMDCTIYVAMMQPGKAASEALATRYPEACG
ncbi:MAG: hypothetical protein MHM6MM_002951 [Cercozoa sp. M6MM]